MGPRSTLYMQFRDLPPACRPAWVVRREGVTLVAMDCGATRHQMVEWVADNLTHDERNQARRGYSQPPVGGPLDDWWMSEDGLLPPIPPVLHMPSQTLCLAPNDG